MFLYWPLDPGAKEALCTVPAYPVTRQNKSYNGTEAKDKPSIKIAMKIVHKRKLLFFFDKLTVI